jgi:hypothetical protein
VDKQDTDHSKLTKQINYSSKLCLVAAIRDKQICHEHFVLKQANLQAIFYKKKQVCFGRKQVRPLTDGPKSANELGHK